MAPNAPGPIGTHIEQQSDDNGLSSRGLSRSSEILGQKHKPVYCYDRAKIDVDEESKRALNLLKKVVNIIANTDSAQFPQDQLDNAVGSLSKEIGLSNKRSQETIQSVNFLYAYLKGHTASFNTIVATAHLADHIALTTGALLRPKPGHNIDEDLSIHIELIEYQRNAISKIAASLVDRFISEYHTAIQNRAESDSIGKWKTFLVVISAAILVPTGRVRSVTTDEAPAEEKERNKPQANLPPATIVYNPVTGVQDQTSTPSQMQQQTEQDLVEETEEDENYKLEIQYTFEEDNTGVEGTPFVATLSDGSKRKGKLNKDGYAVVNNIPLGEAQVELGDPDAEKQLQSARDQLSSFLDEIINEVKEKAVQQEKELEEQGLLGQGFTYTTAFLGGLYGAVSDIVEVAVDVITEVEEARQEALNILMSGDINRAKKAMEELVTYGEETIDDMQAAYDTLQIIYEDPKTKELLLDFPERYWGALSSVNKTEMVGGLSFNLVAALVTGGAGAAASVASKAPTIMKAAAKVDEIVDLLKKVKFNKKTKGSHAKKAEAKAQKPKDEKLEEKEKKKCKYKFETGKVCNKPYNKKCALCNKARRKNGNHKGSGETLGENIMLNIRGVKSRTFHPWNYTAYSIAAHHVICSDAVNSSKWAKYFDIFGYDINHHNNGVMLPMTLESACQLRVALHRGEHEPGKAYNKAGVSYPKAVKEELEEIEILIAKNEFCNKPKEFVEEMNQLSKDILKYIDNFTWTLTSDGRDYRSGACGCSNVTDIPLKPNPPWLCKVYRDHQLKHPKTGNLLVKSGDLKVGH